MDPKLEQITNLLFSKSKQISSYTGATSFSSTLHGQLGAHSHQGDSVILGTWQNMDFFSLFLKGKWLPMFLDSNSQKISEDTWGKGGNLVSCYTLVGRKVLWHFYIINTSKPQSRGAGGHGAATAQHMGHHPTQWWGLVQFSRSVSLLTCCSMESLPGEWSPWQAPPIAYCADSLPQEILGQGWGLSCKRTLCISAFPVLKRQWVILTCHHLTKPKGLRGQAQG